jgi:hypothetical protein
VRKRIHHRGTENTEKREERLREKRKEIYKQKVKFTTEAQKTQKRGKKV